MVFNATFNIISVMSGFSASVIDEGISELTPDLLKNHRQTLSHNVVSSTPRHERD